jgi:hypothetical protein
MYNDNIFNEKGFSDELVIIYVISTADLRIYVLTIFSAD